MAWLKSAALIGPLFTPAACDSANPGGAGNDLCAEPAVTGVSADRAAALQGEGLAGGRQRDADGLVDRRDVDRGVDGVAVDRLDLGQLPRVTSLGSCPQQGRGARGFPRRWPATLWTAPASLEAAMSANCLLVYQFAVPDNRFPRTFSVAYHRYMSGSGPRYTTAPSPL